jgi:hypothetical protein
MILFEFDTHGILFVRVCFCTLPLPFLSALPDDRSLENINLIGFYFFLIENCGVKEMVLSDERNGACQQSVVQFRLKVKGLFCSQPVL